MVKGLRAKKGEAFYIRDKEQEAKIVSALILHEVTRKEIAAELGVSTQVFSRAIKGKTSCPARYREHLKKRLGVNI
jgi:DNA-directed RNA polymerase specialized sigma subunit